MRRLFQFVPAAAGLFSGALGGDLGGDPSCRGKALSYLACRNGVPRSCIAEAATQAADFCSSYLSVTATSATTASVVATVTVTETQTSGTTTTETSTSTTETTVVEVSTASTTSVTGTLTVTPYVPPEIPSVPVKRREAVPSECPGLSQKLLAQLPASKLSWVCSCLGVTATTVVEVETTTASSTATESTTSTTTSTTTTTTVTVSPSTTTTTTTTTTTSETAATETAAVDYCDVSYNYSGGGQEGDTVLTPGGVASARDCCLLCWNTLDCVASAFPGLCQLLVKTVPLAGASVTPQCPLGVQDFPYLPGPGTVYRGPCSPGL